MKQIVELHNAGTGMKYAVDADAIVSVVQNNLSPNRSFVTLSTGITTEVEESYDAILPLWQGN